MSSTTPTRPDSGARNLRLLYLLTFLFIGAQGNFFPLWLRHNGWTATELGWLDGFRYAAVIVMPLYWGRLIDRGGDAVRVLKWLAVAGVVGFLPIVWSVDFWVVLGALTIWAMFRVGQIPALDALTLSRVKRHGGTYGRFRSWGSIGFIAGGLLLGWLVEMTDRTVIPGALAITLALTLIIVWRVPSERVERPSAVKGWPAVKSLLSHRGLRALYLSAFLSRFTQHGLYGFLPLHLKDLGVDDWAVPLYWSVGVMSEVLLIRNTPRLFAGRSTRSILLLCFSVAAIQFACSALVTNPWLLLGIMALHGVSFGLWYVASMEYLGAQVDETERGTAQALFQITAFGFGGTLSAITAGYLFQAGAGPLMFTVAAVASIAVVIITWVAFPRLSATPEERSV
jgi:PPP family 3-phenylpropionic acid transporter